MISIIHWNGLKWLDSIPDWTLNIPHWTNYRRLPFSTLIFFLFVFVDFGLFDAQCTWISQHSTQFDLSISPKENMWMQMYHRVPMIAFMFNCAMHTKIYDNLKIFLFILLYHRIRPKTGPAKKKKVKFRMNEQIWNVIKQNDTSNQHSFVSKIVNSVL